MNWIKKFSGLLPLLLILLTGATIAESDADKLPNVTSFNLLREAFNQEDGTVRIVTILSPSCGYCVKGYRYMRKILDEVDDPNLRLYVVWIPMLSGDSKQLAERMSRKADDPRVIHQSWDETRVAGEAWQEVMDMEGVAWDVYYLYGPDSSWNGSLPTEPEYWEHQLGELDPDRHLSYDSFKGEVVEMLERGS